MFFFVKIKNFFKELAWVSRNWKTNALSNFQKCSHNLVTKKNLNWDIFLVIHQKKFKIINQKIWKEGK
jgi:hypothetical protein